MLITGYQTQLQVKPLFLLKFSVFSHKEYALTEETLKETMASH